MTQMIGGEKGPEWTIEAISGNRIALKKKGLVVKTFYTHDDLVEWWYKRFPDQGPILDLVTVIDRAIRRL